MGNAFMPSVASSLNAGGQDALEQIMKQRLFQQQMQQSMLQGQGQLNDFRLQNRQLDAQEAFRQESLQRYEQDRLSREKIASGRVTAATARATQQAAVLAQIADLIKAGDYDGADNLRVRAGLPANIVTRPKKEETPEERSRRIQQDEIDHADGKAEGLKRNPSLRPTKVAKGPKDNAAIPDGVKKTLNAMRFQWPDAKTAIREVTGKHWQQLRAGNPDLSLSKVSSYIEDMYGQSVTPTEIKGGSGLGGDLAARVRARVEAKMLAGK